jgi:hypothetical protein
MMIVEQTGYFPAGATNVLRKTLVLTGAVKAEGVSSDVQIHFAAEKLMEGVVMVVTVLTAEYR